MDVKREKCLSTAAYTEFYNEISRMTFQMMEDTTDADDAVPLLLYKVKEYFGFDAVSVQEVVKEKARTLRCSYEVRNEIMGERSGTIHSYSEEAWETFRHTMEQGYCIGSEEGPESVELLEGNGVVQSALRIPMGNRKYFTGVMDFAYASQPHKWEEQEIAFLESFVRIISVYLSRLRSVEEANFLAMLMQERDSVTGLYSYEKFKERMSEIAAVQSGEEEILYVYMDVCHFKYINETYGYESGDMMLRKLAEKLIYFYSKDMLCVARVHSDNIVMAVRNRGGYDSVQLAQMIQDRSEKIAESLRTHMHDNMVAIRSGIFLTANHAIPVEEAVSNAAYACKESKKCGGNRCMVFTEKMQKEYKKQLKFLSELHNAIENKELTVFIQPKMMADGEKIAGGEALVRWIKAGDQIIRPDDFIPVFEKSGAIVEVDYFVYREVFAYLRRRLDAGLPVVPVSVNVSRMHLESGNIIEFIDGLFEEYQIDPSLVEFELTESIYIEDMDKADKLIADLRRRGCKVSMDDFGSGYSSLNMLSKMPIDVMKIDRIFLKENEIQNSDRIILECVVKMARMLNMNVVCEGVETGEQYEFLRRIGCDMMQGYYFGKPMSMQDFDRFLDGK